MPYSLTLEFFVQVPPDELMELLLGEEFIKDWSKADAKVDRRVGGSYSLFNNWVSGTIVNIEKDELVYTWKTNEWDEATEQSRVQFKMKEVEHGTEVLLTQTNLPSEAEMESHKTGWNKFFFAPIDEYLANRKHG